jgi:membrane-associated phospholipid phosphatase
LSSHPTPVKLQIVEFLQRLGKVVGLTTALYVPYLLSNQFPVFTPRELPLSVVDRALPFWTWSVVPYFILIGGMYLTAFVHDRRQFSVALRATVLAVALNNLVFLLWPTTYPRPLAEAGTDFYHAWYQFLIAVDTPANCFPSAHITAPAIGCWALGQQFPRWRWVIWLVFIPFALSILTTKQHYVVDLFGGLLTAAIGVFVAKNWGARQAARSPWTA